MKSCGPSVVCKRFQNTLRRGFKKNAYGYIFELENTLDFFTSASKNESKIWKIDKLIERMKYWNFGSVYQTHEPIYFVG